MGLNWRSWLAHRRAIQYAAVSAAVLSTLPSLSVGLVADDYGIRSSLLDHLHGASAQAPWWNVFEIDVPVATLVAIGGLSWWASPELAFQLLRPLATLSHYLDYALWPTAPLWMHLHNIALYAVLVWIVSSLYERLLESRAVAGFASMLYAVDDAHTFSTAWISSRNTILTALFSFGALSCFHRSRSEGSRIALWVGPSALFLAHASSEGTIGIWAYLCAYLAFLDRSPLRARLFALVPYVLVSTAWMVLGTALGYGVSGSGIYLDPRSDLEGFLRVLVTRLPQAVLAEFSLVPELTVSLHASVKFAVQVGGVLVFALAAVFAIRSKSPAAKFALFGGIIALIPTCSTLATGRLLYLGGFGAQALIALLCVTCLEAARAAPFWRTRRLLAFGVALFVTSISVFGVYSSPRWWDETHATFRRVARSLPSGAALAQSIVMIVNASDYISTPFVINYHRLFDGPGPALMHVLGVSMRAVQVSRPDVKAIVLEPEGGYLNDSTSILIRQRDEKFTVGQQIPLFAALVTIQKITADGRPARVRIETLAADDPRLLWVAWNFESERFERIAIPSVGEILLLPGATKRVD